MPILIVYSSEVYKKQANLLYSPVFILLTLPTSVRYLCSDKYYLYFNIMDNTQIHFLHSIRF